MATITAYGEWISPISAQALTANVRRLSSPTVVGDEIWWSEDRPAEGGRLTVMARRGDGALVELLPAPWNARSRVHEYGGRAYLPVPGPDSPGLVFVHFPDQRLYRLDPGAQAPVPLTPAPTEDTAPRYADLVLTGSEVLCVRERHHRDGLDRHVVAVPLDGSAADDPAAVREVVGGSHFLANPRLSPDGRRLAWLAWDHPRMPWDGTELRVGTLSAGRVESWTTVLGGETESVFQPEWDGDEHLVAVSDRTGWWNLHRVGVAGEEPTPLYPASQEFGAPLWTLGAATWGWLPDRRIACLHGVGDLRLGILDPATGELSEVELPYTGFTPSLAVAGSRVAVIGYSPARPTAVVAVDLPDAAVQVVRPAVDKAALPDAAYLPTAEQVVLRGPEGREVHANLYRPRNPEHVGPTGSRPPYVVFVHGGPTGFAPAALDLGKAYLTSRGLGVLDVNYGGSTGYGRAYRERLTGQWGVVDVADAAAAARALVERGLADPARLAIRGGSAGGWTVLCAVTTTDVFAAGTSLYGVADVRRLAETTHDFESRYVEKLVGQEILAHDTRSPVHHADRARCPVLLLQGSDDPIVPREQAERFRDALAANGIPHALVVFPGEQHGFRGAAAVIAAAEAELSFYGQVMGFTPPGIPTLELSR